MIRNVGLPVLQHVDRLAVSADKNRDDLIRDLWRAAE
jgi:hypothetical protein